MAAGLATSFGGALRGAFQSGGNAPCGPACGVLWEPGVRNLRRPDSASLSPDYLVSTHQNRLRHAERKSLLGLQVHHELQFRRLLDRQIAWLGTLEYSIHVAGRFTEKIANA